MVLENLTDFRPGKNRLAGVVLFGFLVNTISLITATVIFDPAAGLVALFLTSAAAFPLISKAFEVEEGLDVYGSSHFIERHADVLKVYAGFFIGVMISTSMFYFALSQTRADDVFRFQLSALGSAEITSRSTGQAVGGAVFDEILANNVKVALISFLVSVIFGAAAVFVITWNASVIAVFVGIMAKTSVASFASLGLFGTPLAFFYGLAIGTGSIALHGVPEIMSYFVSALAGGIISVGLSREKINSDRFRKVAEDGIILLAVALVMIFIAAAVESY
ncbi:MAG: stage II sporulation protein M [Candidatus Aenigmatarchaeota archaeon]